MATLRKRPKAGEGFVYVIDFVVDGVRCIRSTKTDDEATANRMFDDIKGRIARGSIGLEDVRAKRILLKDFFEWYFDDVVDKKAPSTIKNERNYAETFAAFIGNRYIDSIDINLLKKWQKHLLSQEKKYGGYISRATFNNRRSFLKAAFNSALEEKHIRANPFRKLKSLELDEKRLYFYESEMDSILDKIEEDIRRLKHPQHLAFLKKFRSLVIFLLNTGLRRSEALKLLPENIDQKHNELFIAKTKTHKARLVPLNSDALQCIAQVGENLFNDLDARHVSRKFHSYAIRLGLEVTKLHSLRHTCATNLLKAGVPIQVVQKLLGHQDIRTTQVYAKVDTETMRQAVQMLPRRTTAKTIPDGKLTLVGEKSGIYDPKSHRAA